MIRDPDKLRRYIKQNLESIEDRKTLIELFLICLKFNGIPYTKFRSAQFRLRHKQLKLFDSLQD